MAVIDACMSIPSKNHLKTNGWGKPLRGMEGGKTDCGIGANTIRKKGERPHTSGDKAPYLKMLPSSNVSTIPTGLVRPVTIARRGRE